MGVDDFGDVIVFFFLSAFFLTWSSGEQANFAHSGKKDPQCFKTVTHLFDTNLCHMPFVNIGVMKQTAKYLQNLCADGRKKSMTTYHAQDVFHFSERGVASNTNIPEITRSIAQQRTSIW